MDILLPTHALPFFGPEPNGDWGGVPWERAVPEEPGIALADDEMPWGGRLAIVVAADGSRNEAIILTANVDDDNDGPGGSIDVDPYWQPDTSLKWPGGASIDSRTFRGMVMHRLVQRHGAGLGDLGVCCWNGKVHFAQYYDIGPTRKTQEGSEYFLRLFGVIKPDETSRHAAVDGNDVTDFCSVIFPGSAPRNERGQPYALSEPEILALGWQLWNEFTNRPTGQTGAAAGVSGFSPAAAPTLAPAGTAAGISLVTAFGLSVVTSLGFPLGLVLADLTVSQDAGIVGALVIVGLAAIPSLNILLSWMRPKPPAPSLPQPLLVQLEKEFATKEELRLATENMNSASIGRAASNKERIDRLEQAQNERHLENTMHLKGIEAKIDRNLAEYSKRVDGLGQEVRHDVRQELQSAETKAETRFEKQIDRFTDIVRGLGRVEGGRAT